MPIAGAITLADFSEASAMFSNWQGQLEQISSGPFKGNFRFVRSGLIRIVAIDGNQRVRLRGQDAAGLCSIYPVTDGNAASQWHGRQLHAGQIVVHGPDAETDHFSARRTKNLGVSLRPRALAEAAQALVGKEISRALPTWDALSPPPETFAGLNCQLSHLLNQGIADPTFLGTSECSQLEQECVRFLAAALFCQDGPHVKLSLPARSQVLHRAEEFMRSHLCNPVGAIDICRELGVSDRTLRLAFRERYGVGPMVFYKCLRLNAVRSILRVTPYVKVADAARTFGFHQLGNFACDYRRLFNEHPSATARLIADSL